MAVIGVTGGIGSGKSYVVDVFALLGAAVFRSDDAAKEIMANNKHVIKSVIELFGVDAYKEDCELNRPYIAEQIFTNPEKRLALNAIVHPEVASHLCDFIKKHKDGIVVTESAIIFESGFNKYVDIVVSVTAPIDIRIERVIKRDNLSVNDIMSRITSQMSDEERNKLSDFIVYNLGDALIVPQVIYILKKVKKKNIK